MGEMRTQGTREAVNFELNEDQRILKTLVEKFVADRYDLARRQEYRATEVGYSKENWRLLAELGLLALPFAVDDGGLDGGIIETITVMEVLGRGLVAEPFASDLLLAGSLLARVGTLEQKQRWLPGIMAGEKRVVLAHFERSARFNLNHVEMAARRGVSCVELHGIKTPVLAAVGAEAYIVSARQTTTSFDGGNVGFYVVPADAPGIERRDRRLVDGSLASEIRFEGVRPTDELNGSLDDLQCVVDDARLAASADMLGVMSMLLDATLDYVRTRTQFGVPIASFQALQQRLADLYVALEQSRSHLFRAALATGESVPRSAAIAGAKSYISTCAVRLGEECIQFHGGIGVSDDLLIGHGHKRILALATLFGDADAELERYMSLIA